MGAFVLNSVLWVEYRVPVLSFGIGSETLGIVFRVIRVIAILGGKQVHFDRICDMSQITPQDISAIQR